MFEDLKPHIADLRKRLVISSITVIVMFFVCFSYYEPILNWMMVPVQAALPSNSQMVAVEIQETFFTALQVAFFAGFIFSLPVIFWQLWLFFAPGLYDHEKKLVIPFVLSSIVLTISIIPVFISLIVPSSVDALLENSSSIL